MDTDTLPALSDSDDSMLRLAVAAHLARYKGQSRAHTASDLNAYLHWCLEKDLRPLHAQRAHAELYLRWLQEVMVELVRWPEDQVRGSGVEDGGLELADEALHLLVAGVVAPMTGPARDASGAWRGAPCHPDLPRRAGELPMSSSFFPPRPFVR